MIATEYFVLSMLRYTFALCEAQNKCMFIWGPRGTTLIVGNNFYDRTGKLENG